MDKAIHCSASVQGIPHYSIIFPTPGKQKLTHQRVVSLFFKQNPQNKLKTFGVKTSPSLLLLLPGFRNLSSNNKGAEHFWHASWTQAWMASQKEVVTQPSCRSCKKPCWNGICLSH